MTRNISYITYYIASAALMMLLAACSTTSHLFALCKMNMPNKLII